MYVCAWIAYVSVCARACPRIYVCKHVSMSAHECVHMCPRAPLERVCAYICVHVSEGVSMACVSVHVRVDICMCVVFICVTLNISDAPCVFRFAVPPAGRVQFDWARTQQVSV